MKIEIIEGTVKNDGETIGTIKDGVCITDLELSPPVKGAINKEHGSKLTFVIQPPEQQGATGPEGDPPGMVGQGASDTTGEPAAPQAPVIIPAIPKPERDPILGNKCPKFIAWQAAQKGGK